MKQETIKASNIATIFSWGGKKEFYLGPVMLEINAGAEKGNRYSISCHLEMDGVTKVLFSYFSVLTKDEYEVDNKRYAVEDILQGKDIDSKNLTVLQAACKGCLTNRIFVTDLCQGCVDRPCLSACKFGAISIKNGKSFIDETKCKKCKMCIAACSYKAILSLVIIITNGGLE